VSYDIFSSPDLGPGGHDDNLGSGWSNANLDAGVAILGQLASQELIEFRLEDAIGDKLKEKKPVEGKAFLKKNLHKNSS